MTDVSSNLNLELLFLSHSIGYYSELWNNTTLKRLVRAIRSNRRPQFNF